MGCSLAQPQAKAPASASAVPPEAAFKAWNCATCTMAFGGLDKIIESETFFNNMTTFASWVCKASGQVKNSSEICPQIIEKKLIIASLLK